MQLGSPHVQYAPPMHSTSGIRSGLITIHTRHERQSNYQERYGD